ncbi:Ankyrin repeat, partial [Musa troglodytarum]
VSPLVGLISAHTANFLAFNQVCITAAFVSRSSTTAHRAEMGDPGAASRRKNRFPKGGSESSVLHAAARNGDLTTVESICNANPLAVNSRDRHSRTPYGVSKEWVLCAHFGKPGQAGQIPAGDWGELVGASNF